MAALCAVAAHCGASPATAQASLPYVAGVAEQSSAMLDDRRFTALNVGAVRVVVPWDMLINGSDGGQSWGWLKRASLQDRPILVAIDHSRGVDCREASRCSAPTPAEYATQFAALVQQYPWVEAWTPWNEPNHASQPTAGNPKLAAAYYAAARAACARCTLVAGDLLDGGGYEAYWKAYAAALPESPAVVGLHDYYDATYFSTSGVDTILADAPNADVWLTEVGGIVRFSPGGQSGLVDDPARAADGVRWSLGLPLQRPRIKRVYIYQWSSAVGEDFDAGLFDPGGAPRPGYAVFANAVGLKPTATVVDQAAVAQAVIATGAPPSWVPTLVPGGVGDGVGVAGLTPVTDSPLRLSTGTARLVRRQLEVHLVCPGSGACSGRVGLAARGASRRTVTLRDFARRTIHVHLTRARAADIARKRATRVEICSAATSCAAMRVRVRVPRPADR